ncbi:hypothetical protein [Trichormus azollae]|uniref:hypothetical protein n=1 Tax=Trichormus azollae TaxID=1164 RepID=UPI00325E4A92
MGASYIPVDHAPSLVPISGTQVRQHPLTNWHYIPPLCVLCAFLAQNIQVNRR